ncbi:MAG: hypothetical protein ABR540_20085 [Acidimicrobiales bacterium]
MVSFVVSLALTIFGVAVVIAVGRRRPVGTPVTWGEAFVAATWVFGLMMLAYGVLPNQWLQYADTDLAWRPDKLLGAVSTEGVKFGQTADTLGGRGRILIDYEKLRDIIATVIYVVALGGQMYLWSMWQKRGRAKPEVELSSAFGRPVLKKA